MPAGVEYPDAEGDSNCIVVRPDRLMVDLFFNYRAAAKTAKRRYEYPLNGPDIPGSDKWDRGSSASGVRWYGTCLLGQEINSDTPDPIRHALNVAVTRHSNVGADPSVHVLSRKRCWPATTIDGGATDKNANLGDLPYGTLLGIPQRLHGKRRELGLSNRGLVLFDCLAAKGVYLLDGHGQTEDGGAVMQLRIDQQVSAAAVADLDKQLMLILPHLWPLQNPRPFKNAEGLRHSDGAIYAGGGAPVSNLAVNASNAMAGPIRPPVEPPLIPPVVETALVTCPGCGKQYRITLNELEGA